MKKGEPDKDGFVLVDRSYRRRHNNRHRRRRPGDLVKGGGGGGGGVRKKEERSFRETPMPAEEEDDHICLTKMTSRIQEYSNIIRRSSFYKRTESGIKDILEGRSLQEIVCYGVGDVGRSRNAQMQLSCALLLRKAFSPTLNTKFFDPALTHSGRRLLEHFDVENIRKNEEGKRVAAKGDGVTLFYMPHCDLWMYSNVIWSNWDANNLEKICIVGNSFKLYQKNSRVWKDKLLDSDRNCVFRVGSLTRETELATTVESTSRRNRSKAQSIDMAFNNTSVTTFPRKLTTSDSAKIILSKRPEEFCYASEAKASYEPPAKP
eukprot:g3399.t1